MEYSNLSQQPATPQKLPRATSSLVMSILSIVLCCTGIGGLVLGGVALMQTSKDQKLYKENPELYDNYNQVKAAKIIAIIGLVLSAYLIFSFIQTYVQYGGWEGFMEEVDRVMEESGYDLE